MASDKPTSARTDKRSDLIDHRGLYTPDISHQHIPPCGKRIHLLGDPPHIAGRHRQDDAIGPVNGLIHIFRGKIDKTGPGSEFCYCPGPARPGTQPDPGCLQTDRTQERPPDQTRPENRNALKRMSGLRAQGTLK